ncbi:MAG TPA: hypothetical protein VKU36_00525, partial [Candidatus Babeliales bacterium]|nr:hypothetical protein [Candidatus Babeliales bacterium]
VVCPDETKMVMLMSFYQEGHSTLTIVNKNEKKIYDGSFPHRIYQHIALAQSGRMIATLEKQERRPEEIIHDYKNILNIQRMVEKEIQDGQDKAPKTIKKWKLVKEYVLPEGFTPDEVAFNQQDTHVMVRGFVYGDAQNPRQRVSRIVKLQHVSRPVDYNYVPSEQEKQQFLEDPLRAYLRCRLVCKDY